jgi:hypothetical protein
MSRLSAHSTVVASTTVSAVLALCMAGFGATAPVAASSLTSSTAASEAATSVDIAAAIGASLGAGTEAGARTGGGFTRSFATSATTNDTANAAPVFDTVQALSAASALSAPSTRSGFAVAASVPTSTDAAPTVSALAGIAPSLSALPAPPAAVAPKASAVHASVVTHAAVATGSPRQVAQTLAANAGWSGAQWTCLSNLWQRESLFGTTARNYRSGAYGIPQALPASKMATAGADWRTNPATQVKWGLHYITTRYGNPCNAWAHWKRYRSY